MGKTRNTEIATSAIARRLIAMLLVTCAGTAMLHAQDAALRLPGHVLAQLSAAAPAPAASATPLTLTVVLRRDDEAGYAEYLRAVYDPASPQFHKFLTPAQQSDIFGPSRQSLDAVATFLTAQHVQVTSTAGDRMLVSASANRADAERAFNVRIGDYALGAKRFFANTTEPSLPADIAPHISAVLGLTDLAHSQRSGALSQFRQKQPNGVTEEVENGLPYSCKLAETLDQAESIGTLIDIVGAGEVGLGPISPITTLYRYQCAADVLDMVAEYAGNADGSVGAVRTNSTPHTSGASGGGQKVGLVEFDTYNRQDVLDYLTLLGHPERITQLSDVVLGAGANFNQSGEAEVLLDIDTILSLAPGAAVTEYDLGFAGQGSFQTVFNRMLGDGMNVISNSFAYCEDQTSLADVQSLEVVLQTAAMAGVTVVTGSGDSGSTCLDGSANTVAVPSSSPSITAVGGTTAIPNFEGTYGSETWWDGSAQAPSSGQGGFGVSRFFARPTYQNGATAQTMRSVPDVTAPADPTYGVIICEADAGGCPTNYYYGGTSVAAPTWAALVAVMNQRSGSNVGFLNAQIYPLGNTSAFHSAASMLSDFAHVGLGSPNAAELRRHIAGTSTGALDASHSTVVAYPPNVYADGDKFAGVSVVLFDANFFVVPGQSVTLTANAGAHAVVTAVNATSDTSNGAARFSVTDLTAETVTLTAHIGATDLATTAMVNFASAPAASGNIVATPITQTADGQTASTVTVTLEDSLSRPAVGKLVHLSQNGNSIILGANPLATDSGGQAQFQVTDQVQEHIDYSATDNSDFGLAVPGVAGIDYVGGPGGGCGNGAVPQAGPGYALSVYASGFPVQNGVLYGGISLNGCDGVAGIAFDGSGNLFASDYVTGDIYKFPPGGGIASAATRVTPVPLGPSLGGLAFGSDGALYATRVATAPAATSGAVLKVDPVSGTATTAASGMPCPSYLASDPLSHDLFIADFCFGSAQDSAAILRMPTVPSPVVSTYATSSGSPNGSLSFAPDGTLYAVYGYSNFGGLFAGIDAISGTNGPAVPTVATTGVSSSFAALAFGSNPSGGAQALVASTQATGGYSRSVAAFDVTTTPPVFNGATLVQNDIGSVKLLGPDQCIYFANGNAVYKLTNADDSCPLLNVAPSDYAVLTPQLPVSTAAQGGVQSFDIRFPHHPGLTRGSLPITIQVTGVNSLIQVIGNGFNDVTTFTYSGAVAGVDTITASATFGTTTLTSNPVTATWTTGKHATFLDLNEAPASATLGSSAQLRGRLFDMSTTPTVPIAGASLQFILAGQTCSATTDATGLASCSMPLSAITDCTLTASFAGDTQYVAATSSQPFFVSKYDVVFANGFEVAQPAGCVAY